VSEPLAAPERPGPPPPKPPAPPAAVPAEPPHPRLFLTAAAAGLLAALALPGERPGLGVLLVAVAALAAARAVRGGGAAEAARSPEARRSALEAGRSAPEAGRSAPSPRVRFGTWRPIWATLAIACASIAVLRDAAWVVWPAIAGAVGLGSMAFAGGVTWRSLLGGLVAGPAAAPAGATAVARSAAAALPSGSRRRAAPVLRGAAIAAPLLAVFGLLFATGDRAFAQIAEDALPTDLSLGLLPSRVLTFVAIAALVGGLALARSTPPGCAPPKRLRTAEWAIPLAALDLLFLSFVAVQFAVLFGGDDRVLETAGLTYAEYAREGYGQLLAAAALTLAVVGAALRWASGDRRLLRSLLAVLCLLTGVVLASALHRLDLYQDAFGATRLRVTATATLVWLGAILALVLAAIAADRRRFLPRASLLVAALAGLSFALWNPDLRIAERNLARDDVDEAYLRTLSADARPALPPRLEATREADGWGGWNLARR
jgi:Domain of unknown function (DUF4173)